MNRRIYFHGKYPLLPGDWVEHSLESIVAQVARKWGESSSDKEEEVLDYSQQNGNETSQVIADLSKVSLIDAKDDEDYALEGGPRVSNNVPPHLSAGQDCCHNLGTMWIL